MLCWVKVVRLEKKKKEYVLYNFIYIDVKDT